MVQIISIWLTLILDIGLSFSSMLVAENDYRKASPILLVLVKLKEVLTVSESGFLTAILGSYCLTIATTLR